MQDTILRVFVVVVGLIMHPREDLRLQDQDDITTGMQEQDDWLVKEREWLDQEITLIDQEVPKEDQDDVNKVKPHEPQADQWAAQTHQDLETRVKQTDSEDEKEKGVEMMTHVPPDDDDSDQNITPEHQGEPDIDSNASLVEPEETQYQTQPDADTSPVDEEQQPSEEEMSVVDQQLSEDVREGGSLNGHQMRPESEEAVEMAPEERQDDQVRLPNILTESSPDDQREVVETYQEVSHKDKEVPSEDQGGQEQVTDTENNYIWYLWNTYSVISVIQFSINYFRKKLNKNKDLPDGATDILESKLATEVLLPDKDTLNRFYDKCVKVSPDESWRVSEFVEDFAKDLLEAMRAMSDSAVGMVMEDFVVVEGLFNTLVFDVIVSFTPLDPYRFQYQLWCNQAGDTPNMEGCGRIKMEEEVPKQNGCPCGNSDMDNIICLLHSENEKLVNIKVSNSPLWSEASPYLSKAQVTKWFQCEIRQVWRQISHKYEFELTFRNMDTPGALAVRFRSGKLIAFNIKPVVKFKDTDVYFTISPSTTSKDKSSDTFWGLSLTMCEDRFLKRITKSLPEDACHLKCLETAIFLHKMQTRLSGRSGLIDYHFKTALLHLLLLIEHSEWHPQNLTNRLRDLLGFLEESLQHRKLHHAFIGNPLAFNDKSLSGEFGEAKSVNLFRPLVVQNGLYAKTVQHFREMLKNSSVLIQEYVPK